MVSRSGDRKHIFLGPDRRHDTQHSLRPKPNWIRIPRYGNPPLSLIMIIRHGFKLTSRLFG